MGAFHVGAPARWLAVLACAIGGQRKERGAGKKERETATLSSGTSGAARGKGESSGRASEGRSGVVRGEGLSRPGRRAVRCRVRASEAEAGRG